MQRAFPIRMHRRRRLSGLGYPIIPDQFTTAGGVPEAFSLQTPDATIVQILQQQGQQLPAALAAAMAAGVASTTYVAPNQSPITASVNVAPGVWLWTRADGTQFYGDASQNPVSYTPPAVTPSGTPIAVPPAMNTPTTTTPTVVTTPATTSQPTSTVAPAVTPTPTPLPATTPVAVTPSGTVISTTTGTPATSGTVVAATQGAVSSLVTWLEGSLIGGIPNWLLLGGAVAGLMMFGGDGSSGSRRR